MSDYQDLWKQHRERRAFLALADGTVFRGYAFGDLHDRTGEAVFNTGMTGYQEIISDPSYAGQFVTLTTAEVGNYGCTQEDMESRSLFLNGLIIQELNPASNWRSREELSAVIIDSGNKCPAFGRLLLEELRKCIDINFGSLVVLYCLNRIFHRYADSASAFSDLLL